MNQESQKKIDEATTLLTQWLFKGSLGAEEEGVRPIISLIVEAAVEEACERIKRESGPPRES